MVVNVDVVERNREGEDELAEKVMVSIEARTNGRADGRTG